jgi:hypothetical protein
MKLDQFVDKDLDLLSEIELIGIQGGGPIRDGLEWYYKTVGSFYRGLWDGLTGAEPIV